VVSTISAADIVVSVSVVVVVVILAAVVVVVVVVAVACEVSLVDRRSEVLEHEVHREPALRHGPPLPVAWDLCPEALLLLV